MISTSEIRAGQRFYQVVWSADPNKLIPSIPPALKSITFLRPEKNNSHCGEFVYDDTRRKFLYAYSNLRDWYFATPELAWQSFLNELRRAKNRIENEREELDRFINEIENQIANTTEKIEAKP